MAHAARMASIPLHCSICPKDPKFSDPSHLLTHVASKGHLSNQFKVSVRTSTDAAAREKLERYNQWYERYGIEKLLAQRMRKKDAKHARDKKAKAATTAASSAGQGQGSLQHASHEPLKHEAGGTTAGYAAEMLPLVGQAPCQTPEIPLWSLSADAATDETMSGALDSRSTSDGLLSEYRSVFGENHEDPFVGYPSQLSVSPCPSVADEGDRVKPLDSGATSGGAEVHLKGVCWPGMDIFDSATPEMKRKRNQKKDESLALHLEMSSARVEATELTFDEDGILQMERPISRLLEESPVKAGRGMDHRSPVKNRGGALAESRINSTRYNKPMTRAHAASAKDQASRKQASRDSEAGSVFASSGAEPKRSREVWMDEDEEESKMTYGAKSKKRALVIFDDDETPVAKKSGRSCRPGGVEGTMLGHSGREGDAFGHPEGFTYLNSGFPLFSADMLAGQATGCEGRYHGSTQQLGAFPGHSPGKENQLPLHDAFGNLSDVTMWTGQENNQASLASHTLPFHQGMSRPIEYGLFTNMGNCNFTNAPGCSFHGQVVPPLPSETNSKASRTSGRIRRDQREQAFSGRGFMAISDEQGNRRSSGKEDD